MTGVILGNKPHGPQHNSLIRFAHMLSPSLVAAFNLCYRALLFYGTGDSGIKHL